AFGVTGRPARLHDEGDALFDLRGDGRRFGGRYFESLRTREGEHRRPARERIAERIEHRRRVGGIHDPERTAHGLSTATGTATSPAAACEGMRRGPRRPRRCRRRAWSPPPRTPAGP